MAEQKETIYIDIDDEITAIIEKVRTSKQKILALVLPKRAAVLQSIVNMKLLKRTAGEAKKHVVLITSEAGLLPLAGAVGLHVAKTLQSKPAIPEPPKVPSAVEALVEEDSEEVEEPDVDASKSLGELAGLPAVVKTDSTEETIDIDNADDEADTPKTKGKKADRKNKIKIPNFESFRARLFLVGGGLILVIILWFLAFHVMPKAKITVKTSTASVTANIAFVASTDAKEFDEAKNVIPAELKTVKKSDAQKVTATGQKNVGEKAAGQVTMSLQNCSQSQVTVPAGTAITANGLIFVTQGDASMSSVTIGNQCKNSDFPSFSTDTVGVVAQNGGTQYNVGAQGYGVTGFPGVAAQGTQMAGGTDKTITVISQQDVDTAKEKIASNNDSVKNELAKSLKEANKFALTETFVAGAPAVTASPNVGDQAGEVTVTAVTEYVMLGVKQSDLEKLLKKETDKQIDTKKQAISDYGLSQAAFTLTNRQSNNVQTLSAQSIVTAGAQIDIKALKKLIAGKKRGDVQQIIQTQPNVEDVSVEYSPFWVYSTPKKPGKITIVIQKAQTK